MRDGWLETTLGDVAEWWSGGTPKAREPKYYENGTIPWAVIADMNKGIIDSTNSYITKEGLELIGGRLAPVGSVLISMYASVGKSAIANIPLATNQAIAWSIPNQKKIIPFYLYLVSQQLEKEISDLARGATQRNINRQMLREFTFQLPPLLEQKRIVDLISSVDSYIEALQQQLVSAKKSRNAELHKTFHIDGSNWKLKKLVDCTQKISDGSHNPPKGIEASDFLMLSSKDVWDGDLTNLDPRFLKQSDFELENKRTQLESGDVLLTIVGTIGRCTVYRGYPKNVTFQRSVCVIKTSKEILNESFLMLYLQSIQSYLDQNARGVAQRGIYLNQIRDLEIPIPSLNAQLEVVSNIDVFDAFIRETQKVVAQTQKLRAAMLSDLLSGTHEIPPSYDKVIGTAS